MTHSIFNDRRGPPCAASSCLEVAFDYVVARSHASESHQVQARPVESVGRKTDDPTGGWGWKGKGRSI